MAWNYDVDDLSTNTTYQVRLLVGDTNHADQLLQDEEISFFLDVEANIYSAAAECAKSIAAKFARQVDKAVGDLRVSLSDRARHFRDVATKMERRSRIIANPSLPARSRADKDAAESDTDRVQPNFVIGQFDNPNVGVQTGLGNEST